MHACTHAHARSNARDNECLRSLPLAAAAQGGGRMTPTTTPLRCSCPPASPRRAPSLPLLRVPFCVCTLFRHIVVFGGCQLTAVAFSARAGAHHARRGDDHLGRPGAVVALQSGCARVWVPALPGFCADVLHAFLHLCTPLPQRTSTACCSSRLARCAPPAQHSHTLLVLLLAAPARTCETSAYKAPHHAILSSALFPPPSSSTRCSRWMPTSASPSSGAPFPHRRPLPSESRV